MEKNVKDFYVTLAAQSLRDSENIVFPYEFYSRDFARFIDRNETITDAAIIRMVDYFVEAFNVAIKSFKIEYLENSTIEKIYSIIGNDLMMFAEAAAHYNHYDAIRHIVEICDTKFSFSENYVEYIKAFLA